MSLGIGLLIGRVVERIDNTDEEIYFHCNNNRSFVMKHDQDCCESVSVEEIIGDLNDLINTPIIEAEERSQNDPNPSDGSATWTFYEIRTIKGSVTIRWYGSSNGYYSEEVNVTEIKPGE